VVAAYIMETLTGKNWEDPYGKKSFEVREIVLYKSEKDSENKKYHVIKKQSLT